MRIIRKNTVNRVRNVSKGIKEDLNVNSEEFKELCLKHLRISVNYSSDENSGSDIRVVLMFRNEDGSYEDIDSDYVGID